MDDEPLTVLRQATNALELTLRLSPEEIDPGVLEIRARAIATPVVVPELRRLARELYDEQDRDAHFLITNAGQLDESARRLAYSTNEAVRASADKLVARADALNREAER